MSILARRRGNLNDFPVRVEYVVIAGGASGAMAFGDHPQTVAGGSGAGGYRSSVVGELSGRGSAAEPVLLAKLGQSFPVTVGGGAFNNVFSLSLPVQSSAGNVRQGNQGFNSTFGPVTSLGGGGALPGFGGFDNIPPFGSGGAGNITAAANQAGASGTAGQGGDGGTSVYNATATNGAGGGGGGAGGNGANAASATPRPGGAGVTSSITGTAVTRASGGGGTRGGAVTGTTTTTPGGGKYGHWRFATRTQADFNSVYIPMRGDPNTGGAGGSFRARAESGTAGIQVSSGAGGSGVVILRYPAKFNINLSAGLVASTSTVGSNKVTQITGGTGTVSFS